MFGHGLCENGVCGLIVLYRGFVQVKSFSSLKRHNDFTRMYKSGSSAKGRYAVLLVKKGRRRDMTRVGFSVSKKVGNAVTRNRCKRRLREAVIRQGDRLAKGFDLVFIARAYEKEPDFEALCRDISGLLARMNLLKSTCEET